MFEKGLSGAENDIWVNHTILISSLQDAHSIMKFEPSKIGPFLILSYYHTARVTIKLVAWIKHIHAAMTTQPPHLRHTAKVVSV